MEFKRDYLATVEIKATATLRDIAIGLNRVFSGFEFHEDESGCFEEVPAYVAKQDDVNLTLFRVPDGEESDVYIFELSCDESLTREIFGKIIGQDVIKMIPDEVVVAETGYTDISSYMVSYINSVSDLECFIAE